MISIDDIYASEHIGKIHERFGAFCRINFKDIYHDVDAALERRGEVYIDADIDSAFCNFAAGYLSCISN